MHLIDKQIIELVAGYDEIATASLRLRRAWRDRLLIAYAQRRARFEAARAAAQRTQRRSRAGLIAGAAVILVGLWMALTGLFTQTRFELLLCCAGPLIGLLGILLCVAFGTNWLQAGRRARLAAPQHPLHSSQFSHPLETWAQGLSGQIYKEIPLIHYSGERDYGADGEQAFIQQLRASLPGDYFVLARLQQRNGEDVDHVLVGPKGIWVFEIKYWSGTILWRDKQWWRIRGRSTEREPVSQPLHEQWLRTAHDVEATVRRRAAKAVQSCPAMLEIHGGIAFSYPQGEYLIEDCPVAWGATPEWGERLRAAPDVPGYTMRIGLKIVEALLDWHRKLNPPTSVRSMLALVKPALQETEDQYAAWFHQTDPQAH